MGLFQQSVLEKYLKQLDDNSVREAYQKFQDYFHNPDRQANIRVAKEEQFQDGFLRELFVKILGYTINPEPDYNLTSEFKNEKGAKKADGAILADGKAIGVIELKGTDTKDLDKINEQAFSYKNNQSSCVYVITSNFEKLRFFIHNAVDHEEFNLFELTEDEFKLLWVCLQKDNLLAGIPEKIKEESLLEEEKVTKRLYSDYSAFKRELWHDMVQRNPEYDELLLFKKSQKLLDRFLFILFSEDKGLLPPNSISEIVNQWLDLKDLDEYRPLYDRYKKYFGYMNKGYIGKKYEIHAYNGGLFCEDDVLDSVEIDDEVLRKHTMKLTEYDFNTDVDVNILGHIFEHSLSEIENVGAQLEGIEVEKNKTQRKKDGVFYTPKYITKYIVDNTVGKLCEEKKEVLGITDERFSEVNRRTRKGIKDLEDYRKWLLGLTICDPACGSGAFLNQALEFLINEHTWLDELIAEYHGSKIVFPDVEKHILENNLFGVDINDESIEIAKLSLWLRTAKQGRKLTALSDNIKCGNSLIDDCEVAGDKAFNWEKEFPEIFDKGGFDVVIGNPPYGAYLEQEEKDFLIRVYSTFQGNYEIYFFFIELLNILLKNNGKAGYITPDTWINIPQAQKLREHVLEIYGLENIITFNYSVFEEASVNTIIFILGKNNFVEKCKVLHVEDKRTELAIGLRDVKEVIINNWGKADDKQFQVWQTEMDVSIISKVSEQSELGVKYLDVSQGIVPYSTEQLTKEQVKERIYHGCEKVGEEWGLWVQGRVLKRYGVNVSNREYLKYGEWLHRPRKPKYFNGKRILIQEITGGNPPRITAAIFEGKLYHDPGIISCLNISSLGSEYLLAIINSKLISWYSLKTSPKGKRTTFPKILIGDIRKLPIKIAPTETMNNIMNKVQIISTKTSQLQSAQSSFINLLRGKYNMEKSSINLQNWHELDYSEFFKELKKAKVQLNLAEEAEWMNYFNKKKEEAHTLQSEIDRIDKQIDQMVYELYGLTEEEINIVENS